MTDRVVVFGGTGFLGRFVIAALASQHCRIHVICRDPRRIAALTPLAPFGHITAEAGDILNPDAVTPESLRGVDTVVNLVASFAPHGEDFFNAIHGTAPGRLAAAASQAGVRRFIHISALSASASAASLYGRSKYRGECAVRATFPEASILRPSLIFGTGDAFFERFGSFLRFVPVFPLIGGGRTRFQPVYGGDVAAAIVALRDPERLSYGQIFELGGPTIYRFDELIQLIFEYTGRKRILIPVPSSLAMLKAFFAEFLPNPPITRDQVAMLKEDSIVSTEARREKRSLSDLGITPTAAEPVLRETLARFRRI